MQWQSSSCSDIAGLQIYGGKGGFDTPHAAIHHNLINLMCPWANCDLSLYFDNLYTSPPLCDDLLHLGIRSCGTYRLSCKSLPLHIRDACKVPEQTFWRRGRLAWFSAMSIVVLSTHHRVTTAARAAACWTTLSPPMCRSWGLRTALFDEWTPPGTGDRAVPSHGWAMHVDSEGAQYISDYSVLADSSPYGRVVKLARNGSEQHCSLRRRHVGRHSSRGRVPRGEQCGARHRLARHHQAVALPAAQSALRVVATRRRRGWART